MRRQCPYRLALFFQLGVLLMSCWKILGIEPTSDREAIEKAFEQQKKFASADEVGSLREAYQQALGEAGVGAADIDEPSARAETDTARQEDTEGTQLTSEESQIARETVIQVRALLNDDRRTRDVNIWRAILGEPPADQPHIRKEIGESLSREVRPMAENGAFPADVTLFLGDWFGWHAVSGQAREIAESNDSKAADSETAGEQPTDEEMPKTVSFWPAVIGWVVGLVILTSLFSGMGGG
jgi:hypothetical protein